MKSGGTIAVSKDLAMWLHCGMRIPDSWMPLVCWVSIHSDTTVLPQVGDKKLSLSHLEARYLCLSFTQTLCKLVGIRLMAPAQSSGSAKSLE